MRPTSSGKYFQKHFPLLFTLYFTLRNFVSITGDYATHIKGHLLNLLWTVRLLDSADTDAP